MNRWRGLVEFVAVVDAGSFSKAAENLDIAVSQVSKRINDLELRLDTCLLNRSTRQVTASSQGKIFYKSCKQILQELEHAEENIGVMHDSMNGKLKLCCVGVAQPIFLINIFSVFLKQHPKIALEFIFADTMPNLVEEGVDFALVVGDTAEGLYQSVRLAWLDYQLAATPEFITTYGEVNKPEDLENIPCVINNDNMWRLGNRDKTVSVSIDGSWRSSNVPACIEACLCGVGVFMLPSYSLDNYTKKGKLVKVLPDWYVRKPLMAVAPQGRHVTVKISLLLKFLEETMGINPPAGAETLKQLIDSHGGRKKILEDVEQSLKRENIVSIIE